jgi:segregation and condensation protein B
MEDAELRKIIETLLFITDAPLPASRVAQICEIKDKARVEGLLAGLKEQYDAEGRALQLMQVAGGWQMSTRPEYGLWVRKLYHNKMTVRLTQAALETLCIIAYKQPLTRGDIEAIRGVEVIGPLETLTQRKLITVVGRKEAIGRPILYGTTSEFLRQFGLNSLDDLPKLESFNITNPGGAQETAIQLIEQAEFDTALEPLAEGAPPPDPVAPPEPDQPAPHEAAPAAAPEPGPEAAAESPSEETPAEDEPAPAAAEGPAAGEEKPEGGN